MQAGIFRMGHGPHCAWLHAVFPAGQVPAVGRARSRIERQSARNRWPSPFGRCIRLPV